MRCTIVLGRADGCEVRMDGEWTLGRVFRVQWWLQHRVQPLRVLEEARAMCTDSCTKVHGYPRRQLGGLRVFLHSRTPSWSQG